eukprot:TRINITY_DN67812_c6_g8_i1.p1 TRINITY_DN67812_c6_g8~~TRINITY_DN67812_c6_g8_i1.p1  ORF type:complete len:169 (-),score=5.68 TRINITY_DN67812_c6_g8_i1:179-619(-)
MGNEISQVKDSTLAQSILWSPVDRFTPKQWVRAQKGSDAACFIAQGVGPDICDTSLAGSTAMKNKAASLAAQEGWGSWWQDPQHWEMEGWCKTDVHGAVNCWESTDTEFKPVSYYEYSPCGAGSWSGADAVDSGGDDATCVWALLD